VPGDTRGALHPRTGRRTLVTPGTQWARGTELNLPRLTHPRLGTGGGPAGFGGSPKVSGLGLGTAPGARGTAQRRTLGASRVRELRGQGGPSALTSGKKLSIVPAHSPARPAAAARGSQRSRSRETMRVTARLPGTRARGAPPLPSPDPRHVFLTFCLPKPKSLTYPSQLQPFVSSSSKFLTPGRSAPGRRTAGGTFFPG
jgi:hypothetical protein